MTGLADLPVDVSPRHEGERIRSGDMYVELAGPKGLGAELFKVVDPDEIEPDKVEVIGPDIDEMEEGERYPFAIYVKAAGEELEEDVEGVLERRIHEFCNYVEGFMHLNQRDQIWCRVSKDAVEKGFRLEHLGIVLRELYKEEFGNVIDSVEVTIITDEENVEEFIEYAREIYQKRDERAKGLSEEDVDEFYVCLMCQSFAPTHVCVITPDRPSLCGSITWHDAKAAYKIDPEGPIFPIEKGECLDPEAGEYEGVNKAFQEHSQGTVERVFLHSCLEYPHTSCGCFQAVVFYIPEVDGFGIVDREYPGDTPIGLPFSTMAGEASGGEQQPGFVGVSYGYMESDKFLQYDGGWERVVWIPKALKERMKHAIPDELYDKIATEEDATTVEELREFLEKVEHPVVERWAEEEEGEEKVPEEEAPAEEPTMEAEELPIAPGGGLNVKIVLKNAKIYAEKVIIKRADREDES
ncbi:CO dehydrogenase/CO-methylating acetyl-CoA synthase complex subunit beta [Methanopyrus sp. KOL6]|uniref:CO dehydrogenase/CO-methylating acetyl-CoA synthase complex subunit beta n=1 Tax=Methanopyrus sp. KOL6 TaxID=1937004 RepID=UPI000B4BA690|nr:CO dehydrogenase/CO-methylating acetyl-CoA synthase complex subunit beta [Methanopyrus sp. KOL6]